MTFSGFRPPDQASKVLNSETWHL